MALPSFFSDYLSRYTRRQGPFCGSGALDGTEGCPLASVADRVRQMELGLSPLGRLVGPGRLAAPDGLPAGRSGSVRRAAGQHSRARARERGGRTQNKGTDLALGRRRGGFSTQIHVLADRRGRPLRLRVTGGQRHDSTQTQALVEAWMDAPGPA